MTATKMVTIDGNEAVAHVAYRLSEAIFNAMLVFGATVTGSGTAPADA